MSTTSAEQGPADAGSSTPRAPRIPRQTRRGDHVTDAPAAPTTTPVTPRSERGRVEEAVLAPTVVVRSTAAAARRTLPHRPRHLLAMEATAVTAVGVSAAVVLEAPLLLAALVLSMCLVTRFHAGTASIRIGLPHLTRLVNAMLIPFAAVGVGVAFGGLDVHQLRIAAALIAVLTATDMALTLLRRHAGQPTRIVVVGDSDAIARASERWSEDPRVQVVGGLLVNGSECNPPVSTTHGVRTVRGVEEVVDWVDSWAVDLVVVAPGPGITSESVRRLGWLLEGSDATLAVLGVFDSIAPHRIDSTSLAGATLVHARSSRPSTLVRGSKWLIDRVVGAALLVLAAPLLAVLWVWVRLDSPGPALFTQTRVGRDGALFTVYKLRTMRTDAEVLKEALAASDEGNGVLFKMRADPRITRAGRLLRKTSLDELPQLLNVVRGEMSLIGPRPALPNEVAKYDELAARRLAVLPGMTGLWQVSGRSDLTWQRSVELDAHYVDNYSLTEDLGIALRTVDVVLRARGAY